MNMIGKNMGQITEDYVSFEVANLLKEKGFDEPTGFVYSENGELMKLSDFGVRYLSNSECDDYPHWQFPFEGVASIVSAPTTQMAMKWLREVHKIHVVSYPYGDYPCDNYQFDVYKDGNFVVSKDDGYITYEQSCEAAIKYCLERLL